MNIKTYMVLAVAALTAACSEAPANEEALGDPTGAAAEALATDAASSDVPAEPALGENEQPK